MTKDSPARRLPRGGIAAFLAELAPGIRLLHSRRLRGGLGAHTRELRIEDGSGSRSRILLRCYLGDREWLTPERAQREFRTLQLLEKAGVPAPRPLLLDASGRHFGRPAMLLSYLRGRPLYRPRDVGAWTDGLARAMLAIHSVTPDRFDLSWLPAMGRDEIGAEVAKRQERAPAEGEIGRRVLAALEGGLEDIAWLPPRLIHEDFWPGNTVWFRGRLEGTIDWANARLGDPRIDLAQCRIDVTLLEGFEAAERLRHDYQRLSALDLHQQWFFDLFVGLSALIYFRLWLIGYHGAGQMHVTEATASQRIHAFLEHALAEMATGASLP